MSETQYKFWLGKLDKWRLKFTPSLTRIQAVQVVIDDRKYENGEFVQLTIKDLYIVDWEDYAYKLLKDREETKKEDRL